jgi:DNA-binding MarR family transcriptional regulator
MGELEEAAARLRKVIRLLGRRGEALTADDGPTWPQHAVLAWLAERGELTAKALAELERVRPQSMARVVEALEQREWVERTPASADRRQLLVSLTKAGRVALARGRALRQTWLTEAMHSVLTAEERQTLIAAIDLLERIACA